MYLYFIMNKLKEISILVIFGLILFSINSITKRKNSEKKEITISLPNTTIQYTRIESVNLLKKFIYNELFVIKEKQIIEKLKSITENQDSDDFSISDLNIDLAAPIELINLTFKNENYSVLRIKSVKKGIEGKLSLPYFENEKEKFFVIEGKKDNIRFIEKLFSSTFNYTVKSKSDISIFNFENQKLVHSNNITLQQKRIKIKIGNQQISQKKQLLLKEGGLHFSLPTKEGLQLDEQLQQIPILPRINFPFKEIRHISANYHGFKFTENDSIIGIPKIDLLITFNQKMAVDSLISDLMKQLNVNFSINKNTINLGKEQLHFLQINPTTIFLSTQTDIANTVVSTNSLKLSGDLTLLTKLENAGWKGMLIEVNPIFKSTKKLFQSTKKVEFKKTDAKTYEIIIPMKENKNVYHELLKLALSSTI